MCVIMTNKSLNPGIFNLDTSIKTASFAGFSPTRRGTGRRELGNEVAIKSHVKKN